MSTSSGELTVRITAKTQEALDICAFELRAVHAPSLPAFSAGSHIDVHIGGFTRQYSLCNDPSENHRYLIAVLKDAKGRGGSAAMHEQLHPGDTIHISVPRNHFHLASGARRHLRDWQDALVTAVALPDSVVNVRVPTTVAAAVAPRVVAAMAVVETMLAGTLARLGSSARQRMERLEQGAGIDKVIGSADNTTAEKGAAKPPQKPQQRRPSR